MEEKKRVICLVLGRNESRVLAFLDKFNGGVSFTDIVQEHNWHQSLSYESIMGLLLYRLIRKKLVNRIQWKGEGYYQINDNGKFLLLVVA